MNKLKKKKTGNKQDGCIQQYLIKYTIVMEFYKK